MNTNFYFANNINMKKSTKILLVLYVLILIPSLFLGNSIFSGIKATENGFEFNFDGKGIAGLILVIISLILGIILFIRFLLSLKLEQAVFFSSVPLVVLYGAIIFLIADMSNINTEFSRSIQTLLNLSQENAYNTILWAVLVTLIFIILLYLNYFIICKPMSKVEHIVSRLGDGKIKGDKLSIGGGRQFKSIENGLNKINNNYNIKDNSFRTKLIDKNKNISKMLVKILGRNNINELELGKSIKKRVTLMYISIDYKNDDRKNLELNYNLLNSYYKIIAPLINKFQGYVDRYESGGITAIFAYSEDALTCSKVISRAIKIKNKSNRNNENIYERISLLSEEVTFKVIGNEDDRKPTIISDEFTILDKFDKIAEFMKVKIIFSKSVIDELPLSYKFAYRYIGSIDIINHKEILLFEDLDVYSRKEAERMIKNKGIFERGVLEYNNGNYRQALTYLENNIKSNPNDHSGFVYYSKCKDKIASLTQL